MVSFVFASDFNFKIALFVYLLRTVSIFKHPHMFEYLHNDFILCERNTSKANEQINKQKNQSYFILTYSSHKKE